MEPNNIETNVLQEIQDTHKKANGEYKEEAVTETFDSYLGKCPDAIESALRLSILSLDFNEGKHRGITFFVLKWLEKNYPNGIVCEKHTRDQVFMKFTTQPNFYLMRLAFSLVKMENYSDIYKNEITRLADEGNYRTACEASVVLKLFDQYPIEVFCIPMLLLDIIKSLEYYLKRSPKAAENFVDFLDDLTVDTKTKIEQILEKYPNLKRPIPSPNRLSHKPLDKMIDKYCKKFKLDSVSYPESSLRFAKRDISHWIKLMYREYGREIPLTNWREIIELRVRDDEVLQKDLIIKLFKTDYDEANYWATKYKLQNQILFLQQQIHGKTFQRNLKQEETQSCENYFKLPIEEKNVVYVNSCEKYLKFISEISFSDQKVFGLDAEFMSYRKVEKLCLLQISFERKVFLLDWIHLLDKLEDSHLESLKSIFFLDENKIIVGFGVKGDIRILANSHRVFQDMTKFCKNIVDLEDIRNCFYILFNLKMTRGLSGLCESVLGKPMNKDEQIGDWSRRPLRDSQLSYAALDAWICMHLYSKLESLAKQRNVFDYFVQACGKKLGNKKKRVRSLQQTENSIFRNPVQPHGLKLACDSMLGILCEKLNTIGLDSLLLKEGRTLLDCVRLVRVPDVKFVKIPDIRYVVSCGPFADKIAAHLPIGQVLRLESLDPESQFIEVLKHFNIDTSTGYSLGVVESVAHEVDNKVIL